MTLLLPARALCAGTLSVLLAGCVTYDAADIDLATLAASVPALPPGPMSFAAATAFAFRHNPELRQLAAEARAAGADVPATEIEVAWQGDDDRLAVAIDPLALLHLAQRGARADLAAAREAEALAALAVARWQLIGRIAEIYAADSALAAIAPLHFEVDPAPFERAGLASASAATMARGAVAGAAAEVAALAADRAQLQAELRSALGIADAAPLILQSVDTAFPPLPSLDAARILRRPDLALAVARYQAADAEFRSAVAEQYPSLRLGPDIPLRGGVVDAMAVVRLPFGASGAAHAARERRSAAREMVLTALLAAQNGAGAADRVRLAAAQRAVATTSMTAASAGALATAEVALAVEVDAFESFAERAQAAVRDAMEHREAVVAAARSRVRQAIAWGWPLTEGAP